MKYNEKKVNKANEDYIMAELRARTSVGTPNEGLTKDIAASAKGYANRKYKALQNYRGKLLYDNLKTLSKHTGNEFRKHIAETVTDGVKNKYRKSFNDYMDADDRLMKQEKKLYYIPI